jgi:uncharacterized protein YdeI (YjbR/CyaY-like superfamily)
MTANHHTQSPVDNATDFATAAEFEAWLETNHLTQDEIWLSIAKKGAEGTSVTYDQAIELALCFGWIDGKKASHDDQSWLQRFTPRSRRSRWSQVNRDKAERLLGEGRVRAAGIAEIERAKADGRWDSAYAGPRTATIPAELQRELDDDPAAAAAFAQLDARNRFSIIWRINDAKRAETRARRVAKYLDMIRRGERIHDDP